MDYSRSADSWRNNRFHKNEDCSQNLGKYKAYYAAFRRVYYKNAGPTAGSDKIKDAVFKAIEEIEEGKSMSDALEESGYFPAMVTGMVAIGEESGSLPEMLERVAALYLAVLLSAVC